MITDITADSYVQADNTTSALHQSFGYDQFGNENYFTSGIANWSLQYDANNQLVRATDPDGKATCAWHYPDGHVKAVESPAERASISTTQCSSGTGSNPDSTASTDNYDLDGNETAIVRHFNNEQSQTDKWYDGDDRLVEVGQPYDRNDAASHRDYYAFRWLTRYIYDLTPNTNQIMNGTSFAANGELAKVQEYLSGENKTWTGSQDTASPKWTDIKGYSYDKAGRLTGRLQPYNGGVVATSLQYDGVAPDGTYDYGLLSQNCNAANDCDRMSYDSIGHVATSSYGTAQPTYPNRTYAYDADGRIISLGYSLGSSQWNPQTYSYDADGRKTSLTEASNLGLGTTSPATLNYSYYPDGQKEAVSVQSSALTQSNLITYSYRPDGLPQTQVMNVAGQSARVNTTYTNAGLIAGRNDAASYGSFNTSYAYDGFGRISSVVMPGGSLSAFTYDMEGEKLQETYGTSGTSTFGYNIRGELISQSGLPSMVSANGVMLHPLGSQQLPAPVSMSFNALLGLETSWTNSAGSGVTYSLDSQLREASSDAEFDSSTIADRSYNSENHATSDSQEFTGNNTAYVWGPTDHPVAIASGNNGTAPYYETLHWDGDSLLFTTTSSNQVDDVKLGMTADYTTKGYQGVTFWDRDTAGQVVSCHNSSGVSSIKKPSLKGGYSSQCLLPSTPSIATAPYKVGLGAVSALVWSPSADGYFDGNMTFQGTRTYDSNLGAWTTPDDDPGNIGDPLSQKSYAWNGNNPNAFMDTSGNKRVAFSAEGALPYLPSPSDPLSDKESNQSKIVGGLAGFTAAGVAIIVLAGLGVSGLPLLVLGMAVTLALRPIAEDIWKNQYYHNAKFRDFIDTRPPNSGRGFEIVEFLTDMHDLFEGAHDVFTLIADVRSHCAHCAQWNPGSANNQLFGGQDPNAAWTWGSPFPIDASGWQSPSGAMY